MSSPMRTTCFWKLILPYDWELDNMALSHHPTEITMHYEGIAETVDGVPIMLPFAQWEIARKTARSFKISHQPAFNVSRMFNISTPP